MIDGPSNECPKSEAAVRLCLAPYISSSFVRINACKIRALVELVRALYFM